MALLQVTPGIAIDEGEISESFMQATGPGGQNVNKVATAVQLRFDIARSPSLPEDVRRRLLGAAGRRATQDGVLVLTARRYRTQQRNRADALERLLALIRAAATPRAKRRVTRPTAASRERRLAEKSGRSALKRSRQRPPRE